MTADSVYEEFVQKSCMLLFIICFKTRGIQLGPQNILSGRFACHAPARSHRPARQCQVLFNLIDASERFETERFWWWQWQGQSCKERSFCSSGNLAPRYFSHASHEALWRLVPWINFVQPISDQLHSKICMVHVLRHASLNGKCYDTFLNEKLQDKDYFISISHHINHMSHVYMWQDTAAAFYSWVETSFPPEHGVSRAYKNSDFTVLWKTHFLSSCESLRSYITKDDLGKVGPYLLRPVHLPHRNDYGLRGTSDVEQILVPPKHVRSSNDHMLIWITLYIHGHDWNSEDIQYALAQLICLNGFQSNSDIPGTEKIVFTAMKSSWLSEPALDMSAVVLHDCPLQPQQLFMVKGWNRSVCCLAILWACYDNNTMFEALDFFYEGYLSFSTPTTPHSSGWSGLAARSAEAPCLAWVWDVLGS